IYYLKDNMIQTARAGLYDIFKIQGITVACLLLWGEQILTFIGIDPNYKTLLFIDVVGVGVQVIFLSILNILFYLDKRSTVLFLAGLFLVINVVLTLLSIAFGPQFYGYGFALSTIVTSVVGLFWLSKQFEDLEYETFMLQ
ncbi:MAG: exopolysaccharide Pel transporter PelG, partial [Pseudoalteromonas sp.]